MIGIAILILLLLSFYSGARRGIALQSVYSGGFILSWLIAVVFYQGWGKKIELFVPYLSVSPNSKLAFYTQEQSFDLDRVYYAGIAFLGLLLLGYLVTRFVGVFAESLRYKQLLPVVDPVIAGTLNFLIIYIFIVMILKIAATLPVDFIQQLFKKSAFASWMVQKSPFLSAYLEKIWLLK